MDLEKRRYRDFDELKSYCYRVACVVGLEGALGGGVDTGQAKKLRTSSP